MRGISGRIKAVMLSLDGHEQLKVYQTRLCEISRQLPAGSTSFAKRWPSFFKLAAERSTTRDPVAENQAEIVAVIGRTADSRLYFAVSLTSECNR